VRRVRSYQPSRSTTTLFAHSIDDLEKELFGKALGGPILASRHHGLAVFVPGLPASNEPLGLTLTGAEGILPEQDLLVIAEEESRREMRIGIKAMKGRWLAYRVDSDRGHDRTKIDAELVRLTAGHGPHGTSD
jgi:hypothetical protein